MARTVRNAKIDTPSGRAKLKARREPYWTVLVQGCAVGYRRGGKGGTWIARWRDPEGAHHYQSLGPADDAIDAGGEVLDYATAQRKAREWFEAKSQAKSEDPAGVFDDPTSSNPTVAEAMHDYLAWYAKHRKPSGYRASTTATATHILPSLGAIELDKLTARRIRDWLERLADAPAMLRTAPGKVRNCREASDDPENVRRRRATANRVLTILKAALNRAYADGRAPADDAWRRVKPFRGVDAARVRYLSRDEASRLLNACRPDFRRLVTAALLTGCRYSELTRLQVADFIADSGSLLIREAKAGKPRHVPLDGEARSFFSALTAGRGPGEIVLLSNAGGPWGRSHQMRPIAEASKAARLEPPANFHCLRHTWASHRVMAGAPLMVVAQVLGHADTRMVEKHYGHLAPSYVRDVIERTAFGLEIEAGNVVPLGRPA